MLTPWLLYSFGTSALVAAAAIAAESLGAAWRRPRRGVWLAAIVLAIGAPIPVALRAPARIEGRAVSAPLSGDGRPSVSRPSTILSRLGRADDNPVARATVAVSDRRVVQIWSTCSASLLALLLIGAMRLHRRARAWRLTVIDGSEVLVAPDVGPAVIGFIRPRVVLPHWFLSLDTPARSLILRHEREHIHARDPLLLLFAALSIVLLPWNLALWFMARRLVLAVELDCDQRVLRKTASVREYGLLLLEVVRRREVRGLLLGASLIQPPGFLTRRIHAMVRHDARPPRLISLALITLIVASTVAVARLPRPTPLRLATSRTRDATSEIAHTVSTRPDRRDTVVSRLTSAVRRDPRGVLARTEPKPRITAEWENAPIELVVAAFARFAGRNITTADDANGLITARVIDQPWDEALTQIMAANGYRIVLHPDSSITIVPAPPPRSENRRVSGRVIDERTSLPIVGAIVNVAGRQAIGETNRTCTANGGSFALMVPDGEVWLDASAAGYEFSRVTLAPAEDRALFVGRLNPHARAVATIQNLDARPQYAVAARWAPIIVIDGMVTSPDHFDVGPCSDR